MDEKEIEDISGNSVNISKIISNSKVFWGLFLILIATSIFFVKLDELNNNEQNNILETDSNSQDVEKIILSELATAARYYYFHEFAQKQSNFKGSYEGFCSNLPKNAFKKNVDGSTITIESLNCNDSKHGFAIYTNTKNGDLLCIDNVVSFPALAKKGLTNTSHCNFSPDEFNITIFNQGLITINHLAEDYIIKSEQKVYTNFCKNLAESHIVDNFFKYGENFVFECKDSPDGFAASIGIPHTRDYLCTDNISLIVNTDSALQNRVSCINPQSSTTIIDFSASSYDTLVGDKIIFNWQAKNSTRGCTISEKEKALIPLDEHIAEQGSFEMLMSEDLVPQFTLYLTCADINYEKTSKKVTIKVSSQ